MISCQPQSKPNTCGNPHVPIQLMKTPWTCCPARKEAWYYMSVGHKVRQDNETRESMKIQGQVACDSSMLTALTADGSALAKGALPEVEAATEGGKNKLLSALNSGAGVKLKQKSKPKAVATKQKAERVMPRTMPETLGLH